MINLNYKSNHRPICFLLRNFQFYSIKTQYFIIIIIILNMARFIKVELYMGGDDGDGANSGGRML